MRRPVPCSTFFEEEKLTQNAAAVGAYLYEKLEALKAECDVIRDHRGVGLIQGIELTVPVSDIIKKALDKGLIIISAENNVIRFVPPLIVTEADVDEMIGILKEILC